MTKETAAALPDRLRARQRVFDETGGLHGAALFDLQGSCHASAEDVGRHNAVDKVIGAMLLRDCVPLAGHALVVSGRASFENRPKAWLAGVPMLRGLAAVELAASWRTMRGSRSSGSSAMVGSTSTLIRAGFRGCENRATHFHVGRLLNRSRSPI